MGKTLVQPSLTCKWPRTSGFTYDVTTLYTGPIPSQVLFFRFGNLEPATAYYWRAWLTCGASYGPYSEVWSFTTGSGGIILPGPTLVAPPDGSTVSSIPVTFRWDPVSGAVDSDMIYWRAADQPWTTYGTSAVNTQTTVDWGLLPDTTYEWWVTAINDYAKGTPSTVWLFTTPSALLSPSYQLLDYTTEVEGGSRIITVEESDHE